MSKTTSVNLGDYFESLIDQQLASGCYGCASEVIRASLRLLEERWHKIEGLRKALLDGERSGDVGELDMRKIRSKASALNPAREVHDPCPWISRERSYRYLAILLRALGRALGRQVSR